MKNRSPEFFAGIGERGDDDGASTEGIGGFGLGAHELLTGIVLLDAPECN
jgi:hypothetical protein